jgi:aspartokinase
VSEGALTTSTLVAAPGSLFPLPSPPPQSFPSPSPPPFTDLCRPAAAAETSEYIHATLRTYFDAVTSEIAGARRITAYDTDRISSVGERWSTRIMAAYLTDAGHDAPFVESDRIIVTDSESGNAKPILDATRARTDELLVPLLARGGIPLVTGFFGASQAEGRLTTLGRGGSDLTAAVLGYCLDATEVNLYKVEYTTRPDGWMDAWAAGWVGVVHDADPSATIASLSYEEARELAHFAKKVLHPETVSPAVEKAIPIAVRNTFDPRHPGTRIGGAAAAGAGAGAGASTRNGSSLSSSAAQVAAAAAAAGAAAARLHQHTAHTQQPSHRAGSAAAGSAAAAAAAAAAPPPPAPAFEARVQTVTKVPLKAYEAKNSALQDLDLSALHVKREEAALVVLVGMKIMGIKDLPDRVTSVLRGAGIPVYVPRRVNGSQNNFSVIVPETRRNEAVDLLHRAFVVVDGSKGAAGGSTNSTSSTSSRGRTVGQMAAAVAGSKGGAGAAVLA